MEMLDSGVLTGGDGKEYYLRRHLIVLTTNRGASSIFDRQLGNLQSDEEIDKRIANITEAQARNYFIQSEGYSYTDSSKLPPEVVNRIDRWAVAKPLSTKVVKEIAQKITANKIIKEALETQKMNLTIDDEFIERVVEMSFVPADLSLIHI